MVDLDSALKIESNVHFTEEERSVMRRSIGARGLFDLANSVLDDAVLECTENKKAGMCGMICDFYPAQEGELPDMRYKCLDVSFSDRFTCSATGPTRASAELLRRLGFSAADNAD